MDRLAPNTQRIWGSKTVPFMLVDFAFETRVHEDWSDPASLPAQMAACDAQERMLRTQDAWTQFAFQHNFANDGFAFRYPRPVHAFDAVSGMDPSSERSGGGFRSPCFPYGHKWHSYVTKHPSLSQQFAWAKATGFHQELAWRVIDAAYVLQQFFRRITYKQRCLRTACKRKRE
jgi:hypothetical protein